MEFGSESGLLMWSSEMELLIVSSIYRFVLWRQCGWVRFGPEAVVDFVF